MERPPASAAQNVLLVVVAAGFLHIRKLHGIGNGQRRCVVFDTAPKYQMTARCASSNTSPPQVKGIDANASQIGKNITIVVVAVDGLCIIKR